MQLISLANPAEEDALVRTRERLAATATRLAGAVPEIPESSANQPIEESDKGGGALYGIELGYRPGGEDGPFEIVLTPYFKSVSGQIAPYKSRNVRSYKLRDHRDAISLMVRWYM